MRRRKVNKIFNLGRDDLANHLIEYKAILRTQMTVIIKKIIKAIKKALSNISDDKEKILFFNLNLADYQRYLCEISVVKESKQEIIIECEKTYLKLIQMFEDQFISKVNPCRVTTLYHYTIFLYEICNRKNDAIDKLKQYHQEIIENLDTAFKVYLETYDLLNIITDNLTNWIINRNSLSGINPSLDNEQELVKL